VATEIQPYPPLLLLLQVEQQDIQTMRIGVRALSVLVLVLLLLESIEYNRRHPPFKTVLLVIQDHRRPTTIEDLLEEQTIRNIVVLGTVVVVLDEQPHQVEEIIRTIEEAILSSEVILVVHKDKDSSNDLGLTIPHEFEAAGTTNDDEMEVVVVVVVDGIIKINDTN
jgi:predicted transposase YbfD/YdcC